jgi:hypothetical protein
MAHLFYQRKRLSHETSGFSKLYEFFLHILHFHCLRACYVSHSVQPVSPIPPQTSLLSASIPLHHEIANLSKWNASLVLPPPSHLSETLAITSVPNYDASAKTLLHCLSIILIVLVYCRQCGTSFRNKWKTPPIFDSR